MDEKVVTPMDPTYYKTRDLYESTVIHALGNPVVEVFRSSDGVCYFTFNNRDECERIVQDYRNRELTVNAKTFVESMKTMKDFIHSGERRA